MSRLCANHDAFWATVLLLSTFAFGCDGADDDGEPLVSRETHWLRACLETTDCSAEYACIGRMCTQTCTSEAACGDDDRGTCIDVAAVSDQLGEGIPAGSDGLCVGACTSDADCTGIRPELTCSDGICINPLRPTWGCADGGEDCQPVCAAPAPAFTPEGSSCDGVPGAEARTLPGTGASYCVKAHPDCAMAGTDCPLVVTNAMDAAFLELVDQPETYGPMVVADFDIITVPGANPVYAELPRVLFADFPGIDPARVFAAGTSAGLRRGICRGNPEGTPYGGSSELYAAAAFLGECPGCSFDIDFAHPWDILVVATGQSCAEEVTRAAEARACPSADLARVYPVPEFDSLLPGGLAGEPTYLTHWSCAESDLFHYRLGPDAVAELEARAALPNSLAQLAWRFFEGRTTDARAYRGGVAACRP